jgi:hypothetical protein
MGLSGQHHTPDVLPPEKRSDTDFTGGWVVEQGPIRTGAENLAPPAFDLQTVVTHCANHAIPAPFRTLVNKVTNIQDLINRQIFDMVRHQRPCTKEGDPRKQFIDLPSTESA